MQGIVAEVLLAEHRIRAHVRETPLDPSPALSHLGDCHALLKLENLQYTGSFKIRGALSALLALDREERAQGVVAASSGNHGTAVAFGLQRLQAKGTIFVPEHASPVKIEAMRRYGADVRYHGIDGLDTELYARDYAARHGMVYLSPYNDPRVIGGQGTIGVEIARQIDHLDAILIAVGGGGLIGGIAAYLKTVFPAMTVIGCQPANSPVMTRSVEADRILDLPSLPTLSDGTAGGIEPGSITFELCRALVDEYLLVSEEEIAAAMRLCLETLHLLIEGAAGVALAGFLQQPSRFRGRRVAIVFCGANISLAALKSVLP
jgi:threonine dehydratase